MIKKHFIQYLCLLALSFSACNQTRHYQESKAFESVGWINETALDFQFTISDTSVTYHALLGLHYDLAYPYYNLFLQSTLRNIGGQELHMINKELTLFDPLDGMPLGSGSSGHFFYQDTLSQGIKFEDIGIYKFSVQQIMRIDTLHGIYRIGVRLEQSRS